ncbi:MAG TPA: LysM peptidoglycan-binding domain-containing protein [Bacillota bacterium]|nr:LysM peptidoglycan-binding domain-containing protein [Bacillota bacterium]
MFIWPTDVRRITSHFRTNRSNHHGIDIAESGHHTIKAAAAGTVSRSYRSDSYGECIMILHNINGKTWETVYAHMQAGSRKVVSGTKVRQGQAIGVMGNTGHSTGQHLHFEVHEGRWNINKSNAVDPIRYLKESNSKQENSTNGITYLVKAGDSLSKIAADHNTTIDQLISLNGIKNKNLIYPGQVLQLKKGSSGSYTIKKGDTLSQIAVNNKTTVKKLIDINNIKNKNKIQIGQKIKLI